jgi:hypothetical protein
MDTNKKIVRKQQLKKKKSEKKGNKSKLDEKNAKHITKIEKVIKGDRRLGNAR